MRKSIAVAAIALAAAAAGALDLVARAQPEEPPPRVAPCWSSRNESRYAAYAYNHVVIITNSCEWEVRCTVSTNANPQVQHVEVPRNDRREVTTFVGSPAREFRSDVACERP